MHFYRDFSNVTSTITHPKRCDSIARLHILFIHLKEYGSIFVPSWWGDDRSPHWSGAGAAHLRPPPPPAGGNQLGWGLFLVFDLAQELSNPPGYSKFSGWGSQIESHFSLCCVLGHFPNNSSDLLGKLQPLDRTSEVWITSQSCICMRFSFTVQRHI